jgi:hypothetical protein
MSEETPLMKSIMLRLSAVGARVFRNQVGMTKYRDRYGNERAVRYGLCKGSSDIIGLVPVTITPDMIGKTVAVFLAAEVKDGARTTPEQERFIAMVRSRGGIAGVVRSEDEALELLRGAGR